jgi:hypothetical protein
MMQQTMSLPHREQGWLGGCIERWNALNDSIQNKKIKDARALVIAAGLTKSTKNTNASVAVADSIYVAVAAPESILDTHGLTILAIFIDTCGKGNATTFLTDYKASGKSRKELAERLVREACRYATAPAVRVEGPAPVDNTITLADIRREKEAEAAAAAEALRIATFVPPALTPHMTMAYEMGMAAESLRLSADLVDQALLESGRKLAIKFRWNRIFVLLAQQVTLIHEQHLEKRIARHVNRVMDLEERAAEYEKLWCCRMPADEGDAAVLKWKRARDADSWGILNDMEHGVKASYDRCAAKALMIAGVHILMRKWWKQAPKTAPRVKKHVRLTTAEKAAATASMIRKLKANEITAKVIVPIKPVEQIHTIVIKNLPEVNRVTSRDLNSAIRRLVARYGGEVRTGIGGVYIPMAGHASKGFCFVELVSAENARRTLEAMGESVELEFGGVVSELAPTLALSNRKTKEEMEAEKAKVAAEKRAADSVDSVSAAIKAAMRGPGGELKPICLADIKREKMSEAEQALKDKIAAAFPSLNSCTSNSASAKQFEVSFAAAAAKPLPEKVEVIDPFKIKLAGVEYALAAAPTTVIGKAQMALRQAAEDAVAAEERRKARAARVEMVVDADSNWLVEKVKEAVATAVAVKKEEVVYKSFQEAFKAKLVAAAKK